MPPVRGRAAPSSAYTSPINKIMAPPRIQEKAPEGPAFEATLLTANSHADPKMAPIPIKIRSNSDIDF